MKFTKEDARKRVLNCAKQYQQNLLHKKLLIIFRERQDNSIRFIEVIFHERNYQHLTGLEMKGYSDFFVFQRQRQDCSTFLYFVNTLSPAVRVVSWSDKFKHFWLFNYSSWNNPAYTGKTFYATFLCFFPFMLLLCRNMKIKRNLRRTGAARSSKLRPVLYICFYQIVQY